MKSKNIKRIAFVLLCTILTFNTVIQLTGCGPSQAEIDAVQKANQTPNGEFFVPQSTEIVEVNIDTVFEYHQDQGCNYRIAKIPFENKLITIMYPVGSSSEFKIVHIDTNNTIIPNFKKP